MRLSRLSAPPPPRHLDARDVLDELGEDQMNLAINLACLDRLVDTAPSGGPALRDRTRLLGVLRDALTTLHARAEEPKLHGVFATNAPLTEYLRGVHAWAQASLRALDDLATRIHERRPDWAVYRWRIEEAKNFHFDELRPSIRSDLAALGVVAHASGAVGLRDAVESIFTAADDLEEMLDRRFG